MSSSLSAPVASGSTIKVMADQAPVRAVLGPTNTGKTHLAIERMLAHSSGMIGLPLRLLAREVYDKVVAQKGPAAVALITGEERVIPKAPAYWVATVESMPMDQPVDFLCIDEIQLMADRDRGHIFTHRLLHARGSHETMILGSAIAAPLVRSLLPEVEIETRPRFSDLKFGGHKKLTRLPARSAAVAFSVDDVYAMAELTRRQRGGAAIVMGALSPRTRNAQVDLFQSGEVDMLVATDAIGMGLNLDISHVALAATSKFDGHRHRPLTMAELAQIAGRAGRYRQDGSFGTTAQAALLDGETVEAIENHTFPPLRVAEWRNGNLSFDNHKALLESLDATPDRRELRRTGEALDQSTLRRLLEDKAIADRSRGGPLLRLLWDACQIPDFRKTLTDAHVELCRQIFSFLCEDDGKLPEDWMADAITKLDRTDGNIDTLMSRLSHIRTFTYISHRNSWLEDAAHWQDLSRSIEDKLSDALHEGLIQQFVDRRTTVLMQKLKDREKLMAAISKDGEVTVEGAFIGRVQGLTFAPDETTKDVHGRTLMEAARQVMADELGRRAERLLLLFDAAQNAAEKIAQSATPAATADAASEEKPQRQNNRAQVPQAPVYLDAAGDVLWEGARIAHLEKGAAQLRPSLVLDADDSLDSAIAARVQTRLDQWLDDYLKAVLGSLYALEDETFTHPMARGIAFQITEWLGVLPREGEVAQQMRDLDQDGRGELRKLGVRFGEMSIYVPLLLKPRPTQTRLLLWQLWNGITALPEAPGAGLCSVAAEKTAPQGFYEMSGFRKCRGRAVRVDMLERLSDMLRPLNAESAFEVTADHMSIVGCSGDDFTDIMLALGYRSRTEVVEEEAAPAAETTEEKSEEKPEEEGPKTRTLWRLKRGARELGASGERKPRAHGADRRDAKPGKKKSGKKQQAKSDRSDRGPKKFTSKPRREKVADPDSPFAALGALKDKMGK